MGDFKRDELITSQITDQQQDSKRRNDRIEYNQKQIIQTVSSQFNPIIPLVGKIHDMNENQNGNDY
jgi:hypothetical protein